MNANCIGFFRHWWKIRSSLLPVQQSRMMWHETDWTLHTQIFPEFSKKSVKLDCVCDWDPSSSWFLAVWLMIVLIDLLIVTPRKSHSNRWHIIDCFWRLNILSISTCNLDNVKNSDTIVTLHFHVCLTTSRELWTTPVDVICHPLGTGLPTGYYTIRNVDSIVSFTRSVTTISRLCDVVDNETKSILSVVTYLSSLFLWCRRRQHARVR